MPTIYTKLRFCHFVRFAALNFVLFVVSKSLNE